MKKKYFLRLSGCVLAAALSAQASAQTTAAPSGNLEPALYKPFATPLESSVPTAEHPDPFWGVGDRGPEEPVGTTYWDAQSYGCMSPRVYATSNGDPVATWIYSTGPTHAIRGTGLSVRTGGAWSPVTGILDTLAKRTGFPSAAVLGDGSEVVINHNTNANPFKLWMVKKAPGASDWAESALPSPLGIRMLWPKMAIGGPDNMTIHVIGITAPTGTATLGTVYDGLNGHILYYRSLNGGQTWDKQFVKIPGLDSTRYTGFSADSYTIDASGNTVAVGVFLSQSWEDVRLYKSSDNGETWSDVVALDFPDAVQGYDPLPGNSYTVDDIPVDTLAPHSMAVLSNDGFGSVLVDPTGQAHVWFGQMYVMDNDFTDSSYFVYPQMNSVLYWKESFGANTPQIIAQALDYDGDGVAPTFAAFAELANYGGACTASFPVTGMGADGSIYLTYSAVHELYKTNIGVGDKFYRRLYVVKSTDGGETWGPPLEISVPPYMDEVIVEIAECVYPSIPRHVGEKLWVLYQQDFAPGSKVWNGEALTGDDGSGLVWVEVDPADIPVSVFNPSAPDHALELELAPNPASSATQLSVALSGDGPALVEVFDLMGRRVQQYSLPQNGTGRQTMTLPIQHLQAGTYAVHMTQGGRFGAVKLLKF